MKNYIEVAYKESDKPFGEYPLQLAGYLVDRFDLKKGMKILDNGCGRGEFMHAFSQHGLEAYGADVSDFCKESVIVDLNNEKLPFEDNYFDVVFSKSVIEHIDNTEHYMQEMQRVLKPGGLLILLVPDWETQYKIFYYDPTHVHPYTVVSVEKLFGMMGFCDINVEKFVQLPSVWSNSFVALVSKIIRKMGPVKKIYKNKFYRFSRELMVLGVARKENA